MYFYFSNQPLSLIMSSSAVRASYHRNTLPQPKSLGQSQALDNKRHYHRVEGHEPSLSYQKRNKMTIAPISSTSQHSSNRTIQRHYQDELHTIDNQKNHSHDESSDSGSWNSDSDLSSTSSSTSSSQSSISSNESPPRSSAKNGIHHQRSNQNMLRKPPHTLQRETLQDYPTTYNTNKHQNNYTRVKGAYESTSLDPKNETMKIHASRNSLRDNHNHRTHKPSRSSFGANQIDQDFVSDSSSHRHRRNIDTVNTTHRLRNTSNHIPERHMNNVQMDNQSRNTRKDHDANSIIHSSDDEDYSVDHRRGQISRGTFNNRHFIPPPNITEDILDNVAPDYRDRTKSKPTLTTQNARNIGSRVDSSEIDSLPVSGDYMQQDNTFVADVRFDPPHTLIPTKQKKSVDDNVVDVSTSNPAEWQDYDTKRQISIQTHTHDLSPRSHRMTQLDRQEFPHTIQDHHNINASTTQSNHSVPYDDRNMDDTSHKHNQKNTKRRHRKQVDSKNIIEDEYNNLSSYDPVHLIVIAQKLHKDLQVYIKKYERCKEKMSTYRDRLKKIKEQRNTHHSTTTTPLEDNEIVNHSKNLQTNTHDATDRHSTM